MTNESNTLNVQPIVHGLILTYAQGIQCAIAKQSASRYPNPRRMEQAVTNGVEAVMGLAVTANNNAQPQGGNLLASLAGMLPQQPAAEKPKEDPRMVRLETKVHSMEDGIKTLLSRIPE
tara:strand:- start:45 stop:401 length:357 start_codon:yes stop_codon:yes gene_type:complete